MIAARLRAFGDRGQAVAALTERLAEGIGEAIAQRGGCTLALAGGTTPQPLYQRLAGLPLDWPKVTVTLTDERWVAPDDPQSNERLLRENLLTGAARDARLVGLKTPAPSPEAALPSLEARLAKITWPLDFVLLGMGEDGHTASLFPGLTAAQLDQADGARVVACHPAASRVARVSLTLAALLDSRAILLLIGGAAKRRVLERALADGPLEEMPVRGILRQTETPVEIAWFP